MGLAPRSAHFTASLDTHSTSKGGNARQWKESESPSQSHGVPIVQAVAEAKLNNQNAGAKSMPQRLARNAERQIREVGSLKISTWGRLPVSRRKYTT